MSNSDKVKIEVSIILPIYNAEKFLLTCVKSIQAQSMDNWEVILIDDGSQDGSLKLAKQLAKEDVRIRVISKNNEGVSSARNTGMQAAFGTWIMFVDPDDTLEPTLLSTLLTATDKSTDIVACCCNAVTDGIAEEDHFFIGDRIFSSGEEKIDLYKQLMDVSYGQPQHAYTAIGVPWGKLYRKTFLDDYTLHFDLKLKRWQDNIFNMQAFYNALSISYIDSPLYNYNREHIKEYQRRYDPDCVVYMSAVCKARFDFMRKTGLLEDKELKPFFRREMFKKIIDMLKKDTFHPENNSSRSERIAILKSIREAEYFIPLFSGKADSAWSWKRRLYFLGLKNKHYGFTYALFSISRIRKILKQNIVRSN